MVKCMKVQAKHGKVTQNMHGASRNYRYVWDVSRVFHTSIYAPPSASFFLNFYDVTLPDFRIDSCVDVYVLYDYSDIFAPDVEWSTLLVGYPKWKVDAD